MFKVEKRHLNLIPEFVDILVKAIVDVDNALHVNVLICLFGLDIALPKISKRIIVQVLFV